MTSVRYEQEHWQELFWQRDDRYYWCALRQNLFGEWVLLRRWGGRRTRKGGQMETVVANPEEGHRLIQDVLKRRQYRRYTLM